MVRKSFRVLLLLVLGGSLTVAQPVIGVTPSPTPLQNQQAMGEIPGMDKGMGVAATSMIQTCEQMMRKKMAVQPLIVAAISVIGALLALALVFFVVLEIQWIRYWIYRLKRERTAQ